MSRPLRVLLGVSGGIAGYKAAELVRRLRGRGHAVRCSLTRAATAFVTPLTLEVLSGEPVYQEEYLDAGGSGEELHITAARWAEVVCVAPATAHTIAKLALGLADDFLSTTALAFEGLLVVAPAMHASMWGRDSVARNVELLRERGARIVGPSVGPLASGEIGIGRMAEPEEIVAAIEEAAGGGALAGRTVLVAAGPTREMVDPVRYLSNRSSGKMGFALAAAAAELGGRVLLVAGPVERPTPSGVERVDVRSAAEMREEVYRRAPESDLVLMAAAVADFRPRAVEPHKIKKRTGWRRLELEPTEDILAGLPALAPRALIVGFAAETDDLEGQARFKLESKGVDFIVANDVSRSDVGFESDDNEVTLFTRDGAPTVFPRQPKKQLARRLLTLFAAALEPGEPEPVATDS